MRNSKFFSKELGGNDNGQFFKKILEGGKWQRVLWYFIIFN